LHRDEDGGPGEDGYQKTRKLRKSQARGKLQLKRCCAKKEREGRGGESNLSKEKANAFKKFPKNRQWPKNKENVFEPRTCCKTWTLKGNSFKETARKNDRAGGKRDSRVHKLLSERGSKKQKLKNNAPQSHFTGNSSLGAINE